ncbi:MAG: peptide ABC transporter substrate-binding protein [Gemmatimonadota bacterium]|nr:peptide ABC transporter substrate-binding protein [Gemmatimonadota bacterium]
MIRAVLLALVLLPVDFLVAQNDGVNTVGRKMPEDAAPLSDQVYRYLSFEPVSLDIGVTLYQSSESEFMYDRLCMLNYKNELVPGAADRWEVSADGLTWTFYLRNRARWSDGRFVTAHDFEWSFKRFIHPDSGNVYASFYYDIKGAKAHVQGENMDPGSIGVSALDDHTLIIETENPCAYLPYLLAYPTSAPAPRWQVEKYGNKWTLPGNWVGNSSYKLENWWTGQSMSFVLNQYYEGPLKGYLERIVRVFTEAGRSAGDIGLLPYENDEIDMAEVHPTDINRILADPEIKDELVKFPRYMTTYLFFRTQEKPFDDKRVRQAFSHAIDRKQLAKVVLRETAVPAYTMLPPGFPGYVGDRYDDIQKHDPKRARKLMAEAGFPNGRGFPKLEMWIVNSQRIPTNTVSQAVQGMINQTLGTDIKIRISESRSYREAMFNWDLPLSISTFDFDFPDPHSLLGVVWRSRSQGVGRQDWTNPYFDALIDQAGQTMNTKDRMVIYDEAERILATDVGGVFLFHSFATRVRKPWMKGYLKDRQGYYPFYHNNSSYMDIYIGDNVVPRNGEGLN